MSKPTLTVTSDFTKQFNDIVQSFKRDEVLVGIPAATSDRKVLEEGPITNAALLALNEFGSAANNIPPRPALQTGIRKAQEPIAEQYKKAVQGAFKSGFSAVATYYERAGIIAANSVKKVINAQEGLAPPSPATLQARESAGFKGTKALIVTGQMRNAITSVVRSKRGK